MKCTHIKDNGEQCGANAMQEEAFCYLHNPDIPEEQKREAQTRGGANRALTVNEPLPVITIERTWGGLSGGADPRREGVVLGR